MFESVLTPSDSQTETASDSNANSEADEKANVANNYSPITITHKVSAADAQQIEVALGMIAALMRGELSQSVLLKCTQIRALLIAQKTDAALSTATNVLRWNKDSAEVMTLRAIALVRTGNTDSAIK